MSFLSVLAVLVGVLDLATHWPVFRLGEYGLAIVVQVLVLMTWWEARGSPVAVLWSCPYCGGSRGDRLTVQVHIEREHRANAKGV